jgi:hypothetical protein
MRTKLLQCVLIPTAFLFSLFQVFAFDSKFRISEQGMRAVVLKKEITVTAPVWNSSGKTISGDLKIELLDPGDAILTSSKSFSKLKPGKTSVTIHLLREDKSHSDTLLWYRLRYSLLSNDRPLTRGIVALGAITPGMFELRIAHAENAIPGKPYYVRVHVSNPVTHKPVAGVQVQGELSSDSDKGSAAIAKTTNSSGDAILLFQIPRDLNDGGSIKIEARKGDQTQKKDFDFNLDPRAQIIVNTDKMLYQPGQSLHARAIVLGSDKHAIAEENIEFKLKDPDNRTVMRGDSKTNGFGIASIDWDLPDSIELGPYGLQVSLPDNDHYQIHEWANVRISRYDLPNFTVTAKPDRSYYLPDQNASIEIAARYLFGKDLTRGSARLVRQEEGHWDYSQHKWVVDEADEQSAKLDNSGRTTFKVDLSEFYTELVHGNYGRFRDLNYAAYVTDPTSGKTEQRRFRIRISRYPIHVYVSTISVNKDRASLYVSTYFPDGKPAECQISISEDPQYSDSDDEKKMSESARFLRKIKTNHYGVAKISDLQLLDRERNHQLIFDVQDKNGASTPFEDILYTEFGAPIQITTDKALYKDGDPITVSVRTSQIPSGNIAVDLSRNDTILWSGRIRLRNHRGFTIIPFSPEFKGLLTIAAYSLESDTGYRYNVPYGVHKALFPHPSKLIVKVSTDRNTYKPGDETSATVVVRTPSGSPDTSALGVVVADKAVEERIRTDQEFGSGHFGFWDWGWIYRWGSIGGVTMKDLNELDLSKPLPEGMELVAEMLLWEEGEYGAPEIEGFDYDPETSSLFTKRMQDQLQPVYKALLDENAKSWEFAANTKMLTAVLQRAGINVADVVDSWGTPFRFSFGLEYQNRIIHIGSAGPDKQFDTADDIELQRVYWEYFKPYGKLIDAAVKSIYASSGSYIKDFNTLNTALVLKGLDFNVLRDPWGNPYELTFNAAGSMYQINVSTRIPQSQVPVQIWTSSIDYFARTRALIDTVLYQNFRSSHLFPRDDASFDRVMAGSDLQFRKLSDPWGNPYYIKFTYEPDYSDTQKITYKPEARIQSFVSVTRKLARIRIWSSGPDGKPQNEDDFYLAVYSQDISEQSGRDLSPQPVSSEPLSEYSGAIKGVVTDQSEGVIPGVKVVAKMNQTGQEFSADSINDGSYILRNIPPGVYDVSYSQEGFKVTLIRDVPVHPTSITTVHVILMIAGVTTAVEVTTTAGSLLLESGSSMSGVSSKSLERTEAQVREETFTPRLRDYFPETLFWAPSIVTDAAGRAQVKFKLADNITTWKMTVLASTKNGEIGYAEKEFEAFQPFFLDHDPPKILTVGDSIDLPVVVRNYLPQAQKVNIEMKPASWFDLLKPGKQAISVNAGESTFVVFPFRAKTAVKSGKQQVHAANRSTGDAIEKAVRVHPDGLEQSSSVSGLLGSNETFLLQVSRDMIPDSLNAYLKIYPNLLAHITESIEAGLQRPYGCGEQIISSTYPSLILLKYYKASGKTNAPLKNKAERYLKLGYQRLLNYREPDGGFSYWGHDTADVALTAYAIRFLIDATAFTDVDPEIISNAGQWLLSKQEKDGSWHPHYGTEDGSLTGYIAVSLAETERHSNKKSAPAFHEAIHRALDYLSDPHQVLESPYALAEFALASAEFGDTPKATGITEKLSRLAVQERGGFYWALNDNTPFYGWGRTGRIENSAMALLALSSIESKSPERRKLIDGGIFWLLQQKDRYGVWYSGQATVTVLSAILKIIANSGTAAPDAQVSVFVNDQPVELNRSEFKSDAPIILEISSLIRSGNNSIKVESTGPIPTASIQAVAEYYIPWSGPVAREVTRPGDQEGLRLAAKFDKTEAKIGDLITCTIEAERIGSRGWGMMIAEVGLPPGSDVDRSKLDEAIRQSGWAISRYEILPDHIVLYLWPRSGGVQLRFGFRLRYGITARTAPSVLYDYYNPDAQVSLPPADFAIRPAEQAKDIASK